MADQNVKYQVQEKGQPLERALSSKPTIEDSNEVLIRVKAIALNPADCKSVDEGLRVTSWPFIPGLDGAGIVEAVGDNAKNFAVGDEILGTFGGGGRSAAGQQFAVVNQGKIVKKPSTWSFEDAASLGVSFYTAVAALGIGLKTPLPFLKGGATTGLTPASVLILGASSALGAATIRLLRLALPDCKILATSSPKHHSYITTDLGASKAFDRSSASLVEDIKAATPKSRGVDAIVDTVGAGGSDQHIFSTLDADGPKRYAQVWTGYDEIKAPDGVDSVMFSSREVPSMPGGDSVMAALQTLLNEDKYRLPVPVRVVGKGLDQLEKGLDMMRKGASGEKLVVSV